MNTKTIFVLWCTGIVVQACAPEQFSQATVTLTLSPTELPSVNSPIPLIPGVETEKVVNFSSDQFTFREIENFDGLPASREVTPGGLSKIF